MSINNIGFAAESRAALFHFPSCVRRSVWLRSWTAEKNKAAEEKRTKNDVKEKQLAAKRISPLQLFSFHHAAVSLRRVSFSRFDQVLSELKALQFIEIKSKTLLCNKKLLDYQLDKNIKVQKNLKLSVDSQVLPSFVDIYFSISISVNLQKYFRTTLL